MSDTDDTDVLLLIPPDFFLVHSDSDASYNETLRDYCDPQYTVVDNLIIHVNKLEERLNRIELLDTSRNSLSSLNSTLLPASEMSTAQYNDPNYYHRDNFAPSSTKSTPQKPHNRFSSNSLPSTPSTYDKYKAAYRHRERMREHIRDVDESSVSTNSDRKRNKQILGEIDEFLSNVKSIQKFSQKNFNNAFTQEPSSLPIALDESPLKLSDLRTEDKNHSGLNMKEVDRLLREMEMQQKRMNESEREIKKHSSRKTWKCGENKNTVPDLGIGMRDILYADNSNKFNQTTTTESDNSETTKSTSLSTTENTVRTNPNYPNKNEIIEQPILVKRAENSLSLPTNVNSNNTSTKKHSSNVNNSKLFSLNELWCTKDDRLSVGRDSYGKLLPKLEEEKYRRQHCEKLINELQIKVLEMQQRLAVAVQVDAAKDEAIVKFHNAWESAANRWQTLEDHRNSLNAELVSLREKTDAELIDAAQKVSQCEIEVSKALDLAHANQEKLQNFEHEKKNLLLELESIRTELESTRHKLHVVEKERQKLTEIVGHHERESQNSQKLLAEAQSNVTKIENALKSIRNELKVAKEEQHKLENKLKTERMMNVQLETDKKNLMNTIEASKTVEKTLQQELRSTHEQNERSKAELRNFYQQQVEILVRDKLKEFQLQLEQAEKSLHEEMQTRELNITRTAAKQLQKLSEKHQIEIHLLEEKHNEEIQLYNLQINQLKQQISLLQTKLEQYNTRRSNIAQELRGVMEAQWLEALRIINNGKSPFVNSDRSERDTNKAAGIQRVSIANEVKQKQDIKQAEEHSIIDIGESAFKSTPLSSRPSQSRNEEDLQKYIKMLLEKLPGQPADRPLANAKNDSHISQGSSADYVDLSCWNQVQYPCQDRGPRK